MPSSASSTITVRPYKSGDEQAIGALITSIQRDEFEIPLTLAEQPDLADIDGFYGQGSSGFWIAENAGSLVGCIGLLDITNKQAALRKMFVQKNYRGSDFGVAKSLLDALLAACKERAIGEIYLGTTADFLAAHRFYEKNGFRRFSNTDLPPRFPIMAVDNRFYQLIL